MACFKEEIRKLLKGVFFHTDEWYPGGFSEQLKLCMKANKWLILLTKTYLYGIMFCYDPNRPGAENGYLVEASP